MFQFLKGKPTNQSKICVSGFYCYLQTSAVSACGASAADMGDMCAVQRLQKSYRTAGSGKRKKKTDNRMVVHTSKIFKTYSQHHGTMRMSERFWFDLVGATLCTADISHSKREV